MSSVYKTYDKDLLEALHSNFLIDSWSYSKVSAFARNEKAFEMSYIFGVYSKNSASSVAGQAYHAAIQRYFEQKKNGIEIDIVELERIAFEYIDDVKANYWKLQKTTPTIEECIKKSTSLVSSLLRNFVAEKSTFEKDIKEIIGVELFGEEYISVNGVDIPLPLRFKIDLIVRTIEDKIAIIDHKTKASYTSEDEMALAIGRQAITYVLGYEEVYGQNVDEVWFIENKYSQNKDKSPQLSVFKLHFDQNVRRLYEALLYEPLRRMISAVNDPDYVYLINDSDNYVDRAELYDFWARTMITEVEDWNVEESKKELVSKRLKKIRDASIATITPNIIKKFRENAATFIQYDLSNKNMTQEEKIEHILRSFGITSKVAHTITGFSCDTYLLEVSAGVKISSIFSHKLDIANALDVPNVRIANQLSVFENKSYLPIELSKKRDRNLFFDSEELKGHKIPLGKDNLNNTIVWDLDNNSTPHALICGATGSGKSVCVRSIIEYAKLSDIKEIVILDPKFEFLDYNRDSNVVVVNDILDIENVMERLVKEMNERVKNGVNKKTLIVFDEFADALMNSRSGNDLNVYEDVITGIYANGSPKTKRVCADKLKSLEENLRILLQKGRSCGFRIVAATQRASVKVITGDAKVNFPVQICFRVPKEADSRVVLDEAGAECLSGSGDGLIKSPEYNSIVRFQAYFKPITQTA